MSKKIETIATALEWEYCTPQATRYCENAFSLYKGEKTLPFSYIGFQQPVNLSRNSIDPLSSYDFLAYNTNRIGDVIIEHLDDEVFSKLSNAVLASHLGNADTLLASRLEQITAGGWFANGQVKRTVLRDMLVFTPVDPEDVLSDMEKQRPALYAKQKALGFPGLCVIVLSPHRSNHDWANNLQRAACGAHLGQTLLGDTSFNLQAPTTMHLSS